MKKSSMKKPKDLNAPKRSMSAYFLWMGDMRKTQTEWKTMGVAAVAKQAGQMWKELDASKKAKYQEAAEKAKAEWQKKLAAYKETDSYAQFQITLTQFKKDFKKSGGKKSSNKFKKDPNMPKIAQTGFFLFMAENRSKYHVEGQRSAVTITKVSDKWKSMSEAEKG